MRIRKSWVAVGAAAVLGVGATTTAASADSPGDGGVQLAASADSP